MAITKLSCLKSAKRGNASQHLRNCLAYILKELKTEGGRWVGGNSGTEPGECYRVMMDTKRKFRHQRADKLLGRQGYHFVISLPPGEGDMKCIMKVTEEFCMWYLGDAYDYVYAGHTDTEHKHSHIVFNSVSRVDGRKYHYQNGDWKKEIQPLVNEICEKYGLSTLEIGSDIPMGENLSYHAWEAAKKGKWTWRKVVKLDIDRAVRISTNEEQLYRILGEMGYQLRMGYSKKYGGEYYSIKPPGSKAVRSYQLGEGYQISDLRYRIKNKTEKQKMSWGKRPRLLRSPGIRYCRVGNTWVGTLSTYQQQYLRRIQKARQWYRGGDFGIGQTRRDFLELQKLSRELGYMCRYQLKNPADVKKRLDLLGKIQGQISANRKELYNRYRHYQGEGADALFKMYEAYLGGELPLSSLPYDLETLGTAYGEYNKKSQELILAGKECREERKICKQILDRAEQKAPSFREGTGWKNVNVWKKQEKKPKNLSGNTESKII